jgi:hypothetical protein
VITTGSELRLAGGIGAGKVKTGSSVRTGAGETEEMEWSATDGTGLSREEAESSMRTSATGGMANSMRGRGCSVNRMPVNFVCGGFAALYSASFER